MSSPTYQSPPPHPHKPKHPSAPGRRTGPLNPFPAFPPPTYPKQTPQCPWEEDWAYAEAVCKQAGNVPLEAVPLQKEYWDQVCVYLCLYGSEWSRKGGKRTEARREVLAGSTVGLGGKGGREGITIDVMDPSTTTNQPTDPPPTALIDPPQTTMAPKPPWHQNPGRRPHHRRGADGADAQPGHLVQLPGEVRRLLRRDGQAL